MGIDVLFVHLISVCIFAIRFHSSWVLHTLRLFCTSCLWHLDVFLSPSFSLRSIGLFVRFIVHFIFWTIYCRILYPLEMHLMCKRFQLSDLHEERERENGKDKDWKNDDSPSDHVTNGQFCININCIHYALKMCWCDWALNKHLTLQKRWTSTQQTNGQTVQWSHKGK